MFSLFIGAMLSAAIADSTKSRHLGGGQLRGNEPVSVSLKKFLSHLRSLLAEDPNPDGLNDGLGGYAIAIIAVISTIIFVVFVAWILYRLKVWMPRERRGSKTGNEASSPESDQLIPATAVGGVAEANNAGTAISAGGSTVVVPSSGSPSNIFTTRK